MEIVKSRNEQTGGRGKIHSRRSKLERPVVTLTGKESRAQQETKDASRKGRQENATNYLTPTCFKIQNMHLYS